MRYILGVSARVACAVAFLALVGHHAQARNTGCNVQALVDGQCSSDEVTAMNAGIKAYVAAHGTPKEFSLDTTVYELDNGVAVCGHADGTRFLWSWRSDTDETALTTGKMATLSWSLLCR